MSLQAHLSELAAKHKALESELTDALAHPASTDQEIAELKRKKLRIKDEISRIESQLQRTH
ncbi:MAG: YdcH family protein [Hyphomicrobiales bacterium]